MTDPAADITATLIEKLRSMSSEELALAMKNFRKTTAENCPWYQFAISSYMLPLITTLLAVERPEFNHFAWISENDA